MANFSGCLFRGDGFVPNGANLVAKSGEWTRDTHVCSMFEHVTKNPRDSCWISFSGNPEVAFWFAIRLRSIGDTVHVTAWTEMPNKVYSTRDYVKGNRRGTLFALGG